MGSSWTTWNNLVYYYSGLGLNAIQLGLDEEAFGALNAAERILREHFQDEEFDERWCMLNMGRCLSLIKRDRLEEAREVARQIIQRFPLDRLAAELQGKYAELRYQYLALFYAELPWDNLIAPHELVSVLEQHLQSRPETKSDWVSLALMAARNKAGDYERASQVLDQLERHTQRSVYLYGCVKFLGSQVLWNLGDKESANRLFDQGLKIRNGRDDRGLGARIRHEAAVLLGRTAEVSGTVDNASPPSEAEAVETKETVQTLVHEAELASPPTSEVAEPQSEPPKR
jgi:tetratricopeptide (TPR) repeat protein